MSLLIRMGSTGPEVVRLQTSLNFLRQSDPMLDTDGIFGPKTHAAVLKFQRNARIAADGLVGPITAKALVDATLLVLSTQRAFGC